jgi:hypothetical protein
VFAVSCWFLLGLVNVLLLYNTFRVIGPAFDAVSGSSDTIDAGMESFGSLEKSYNSSMVVVDECPKVLPASSVRVQPIQAPKKIRFASQPTRTRTLTPQAPSNVNGYSSTLVVQNYPERGGSTVTAASLQRPIAPISQLNDNILTQPELSLKKGAADVPRLRLQTDQLFSDFARLGSASPLPSSAVSLPPPPRHTRSQIARKPTLESLPPSTPTMYNKKSSPSTLSPGTPVSESPTNVHGGFQHGKYRQ